MLLDSKLKQISTLRVYITKRNVPFWAFLYYSNVLTITEDGESETQSCTVTSTSLTVIFSETETYTEDYMGQEATITESSDMTLNATRQ